MLQDAPRWRETWERLGGEESMVQAMHRAPQSAGPPKPTCLCGAPADSLLWLELCDQLFATYVSTDARLGENLPKLSTKSQILED